MHTWVIVFCPHFWRRRWWHSPLCEECQRVWELVNVIRSRRNSGKAADAISRDIKSGHIEHTLREAIEHKHPECSECEDLLIEWNRRDIPQ